MTKIVALSLVLILGGLVQSTPVHAANGHENSCQVTNVGYDAGEVHVICSTGSINYAFLSGATNLNTGPGTCPTVDADSLKMFESMALVARATGLVLTIWYTNGCIPGTIDIHAITGIEMQGN